LLSAFSGLAVLCVLVAVLFALTLIGSGESAHTRQLYHTAGTSKNSAAPVPSITFYLFDSDAQAEEIREIVEFAAAQLADVALQYSRVVTLLAGTPEEEALVNARIVEHLRSSKAEPLSIDVVDLGGQKPK
jgi:nucleotide-binding universal stress UspA family protein